MIWCAASYRNSSWFNDERNAKQGFGPILFREECVFRKEIKLGDIFMHTKSSKVNADASRWSIVHEFRNDKTNFVQLSL
jgi:acyl-CoA thioesterase FadM